MKLTWGKWALVRDETSIDVERLTPNNLEKIYIALQDMRRLFRSRNRSMLDQGNKGNPTEQQMFFINLLDKTRFYFDNKISRFQLRYGLRRDDNFGERLASRVLQWRLRLQNLEALLSSFPTIANDVLPLEQQDESKFYHPPNPFSNTKEIFVATISNIASKTSRIWLRSTPFSSTKRPARLLIMWPMTTPSWPTRLTMTP